MLAVFYFTTPKRVACCLALGLFNYFPMEQED
jgi:hypothetical protein